MIRALIVEDEPPILRSLCAEIRRLDPEFEVVDTAMDGLKAMKLASEKRYDILFTDIRIPIVNGLELMEYMKRHAPKCYIVVISGYPEFAYVRSALLSNAQDYLVKPVMQDVLGEVLSKAKASILATRFDEQRGAIGQRLGSAPIECGQPTAAIHAMGE